jgi:tRNA dimethylallyltransferase
LSRPTPPAPVYVCGPTAAGKSAFAIQLAEQLDGEIVNADAFQLFRGVATLTAAPTAADRARIPHHLFGVLDPSTANDAFRFRELAAPVIAAIAARGRTPVVVGGAGLYLKFLTHGPSPLPPASPGLRREFESRPLADLVRELEQLDPAEAARIDTANRRYVTRALEICRLTGAARVEPSLRGFRLVVPRPDLHARIAHRTTAMLDAGAVEEVASLPPDLPTLGKAIGIAEIRALLAGEIDRPTCEQRINTATRRYAKRQETWFRREPWLTPTPTPTPTP